MNLPFVGSFRRDWPGKSQPPRKPRRKGTKNLRLGSISGDSIEVQCLAHEKEKEGGVRMEIVCSTISESI